MNVRESKNFQHSFTTQKLVVCSDWLMMMMMICILPGLTLKGSPWSRFEDRYRSSSCQEKLFHSFQMQRVREAARWKINFSTKLTANKQKPAERLILNTELGRTRHKPKTKKRLSTAQKIMTRIWQQTREIIENIYAWRGLPQIRSSCANCRQNPGVNIDRKSIWQENTRCRVRKNIRLNAKTSNRNAFYFKTNPIIFRYTLKVFPSGL